ncbi:MAG: YDG domain-containing protein, partial [Patescibacteria group bacterium]
MTISQKLTSFVRGASFAFLATALLFSAGPGVAFAAAPVALGDSYTATINTPLSVNTASGVLANDTDDLGPLAATAVVAGATSQGGVYDLSADGSFVYTPLTGFTGVDTFAYEVNDAALEGPSVASVEITVEDPSVANVDTEVELEAALANPAIETINITDDIVGITNTIVVDREVTIQGGGNTLTFSGLESATPNDEAVTIVAPATINNLVIDANLASTTSWVGTYGLQVYNSTATLSDITVTGANGGMYANNSTVVLSGTITVSGNGFGGIESSGASASLDVSGASLVNTSEAYGFPTIWEDGLTGTTVVNYGSITRITKGVQYQYYLSDENSKIPQIITFADPVDVIYGDASSIVVAPTADSGLTVSVTTSGTCTNTDFTIDFSVVGTCTVTASQAGDSEYAPAADVVQSFAIAPRPITVLAIAADKEYDTTTSSSGVPILSGTLATGDDAVYTQTYADENVNPGITLTPLATITNGGDNVNSSYAITYMTASGSISAVSLTPTTLAASKTYDGDVDTTATPSVTPLSGDDVTATYVSATFDTKDVGTLKTVTVSGIALDGAQAGNYTLTSTTAAAQANITQALLSAEVTVDNKVYDNTTAATINGYTPVGLVGIEDVTINGGVATFDTEHVGNGKIVSVSGLNLVADSVSSNYSFTDIDITTADITERAITVTAVTDTKVYDATTASAGVPVITGLGLAAGDTTGFSQVFDDVEAGTGKTLSAEGAVNDGNNGDNYAVTLATALGTVTKAPLTITADNKTKVYGTANPIATATYTGFMGGEDESVLDTDVTLVIVANSQTDVNNHPITAFGAADDNYAITHVNGNLEITKLPITALVVADDKVYDGTTDADVALTLDGVLFADVVTVSNTGADFDTQDVG